MSDGVIGRWGAVVREAFAVLAAILIAFALDAWWDARVERAAMLEALDAVAVEIDRNVTILDSTRADNARQAAAVDRVLALTPAEVRGMDPEGARQLSGIMNYSIAQLELGAITAFIDGGFLGVVDDRNLRAELAGIPRLSDELAEEVAAASRTSSRFFDLTMEAVPPESLGSVEAIFEPAFFRSTLLGIAEATELRTTLVAQTFALDHIYGPEVDLTRERLLEIRAAIDAWRTGG